MVTFSVVNDLICLFERNLLEFLLNFENIVEKIVAEIFFVLFLLYEYFQVFEVFEGESFVFWEIIFNTSVPSKFFLLSVGSLLSLTEQIWPCRYVKQLSKFKFSTPKIFTESSKITFPK